MTTQPSATPNDGLIAVALACEHCTESVHLYGSDMKGHAADIRRVLAELAAARAECERLRNIAGVMSDAADTWKQKNVALSSTNSVLNTEVESFRSDALEARAELARLRAEKDECANNAFEQMNARHAADERVAAAIARAERAEAAQLDAIARRDIAEAQLAAARKDSLRLDWLVREDIVKFLDRAAIDAAMTNSKNT